MVDPWEKYYKDVYSQDNPNGEAHGWIQWKGTSVCIDLHCVCGYHGHCDEEFFYNYECPSCHAKYAVGSTVKLIPLTPEQIAYLEERGTGFKSCPLEVDE